MYDSKEVIESIITPGQTNSASTTRAENAVVKKETAAEEKIATVKDQAVKKEKPLQRKKPEEVKKKKLNYKLFSRAPLERRYVEKEFKAEELKVARPGKIVQKNSLEKNKE